MRILFSFVLFCNFIFAQYNSTMYDLIKTTYERSFDKQIIQSYLTSESEEKIKAALLSISQSDDTSFVPEIINLDLLKYGSEVSFALGQIGKCNQSINFLWKYLNSSPPPSQYPNIFFAIGKIGTEEDINKLVRFYTSFDTIIFPFEGISRAILQFQLRGIRHDTAKSVLEKEILQYPNNKYRVAEALFVLSRYNGSARVIDKLKKILLDQNKIKSQYSEKVDSLELLKIACNQYALMNFQKLKFFPTEGKFLKSIFSNDDILFYIELAKSIVYLDFTKNNVGYLPTVFQILDEKNLNVAIQGARSLGEIDSSIIIKNKIFVRRRVLRAITDYNIDLQIRSELFLTGYKLLGNYKEFSQIINWFKAKDETKIKFTALNPDTLNAVKSLIQFYNSPKINSKIESLTQLVSFIQNKNYQSNLLPIILDAIASNYPPLISIAAEGIGANFILNNSKRLKEILSEQLTTYKDNPDFLEAIMSLINLSGKIDKDFYSLMIDKVKSSKLYSLRKFIAAKTGSTSIGYKELDKFEDIWDYAFKYKQAIINTSKGVITIQFNSEVAPITVANFCMLVKNNFYNGIIFHRVVPGFVIQAGDPTATGWGGPGYDIVSEFSDSHFGIGYVGMASAGKDTEGSQFFMMQGNYPHLNSRYSLFAKVINGMEVVYNITQEDKILSIELID